MALAGGSLLVVATLLSAVATLIVPRDTPARIAGLVAKVYVPLFRWFSKAFRSYESKDRWLSFQAPWYLLTLLVTWLVTLFAGYGLIIWGITKLDAFGAFREAGSSILTLGFAATRTPGATAVDFLAAATGFGLVALLVGYLPVLYGAFNRRETSVTMLESRAGSPAWGPEVLWRHQRIDIMDSLPAFYEHWETWCADLAESHSSYPVLLYFRSPDPMRSWLTALLAVLDSAALYTALAPEAAPSEARLCLRMGFSSLRTLADAIGVRYDPDPLPTSPIQLTYEEYMRGVKRLADIGFPVERSAEEAWEHFRGWRVNYEEVVLALADAVVATPGPWAGTRSILGNRTIGTVRPVDRTPDEPEGTEFTKPGTYETN